MKINLEKRTGEITLKSDHSMFTGNKPKVITNNMYSDIIPRLFNEGKKESIEDFGLFENSTPNYTTYYPDVKPEDLMPKDEDFIYPVFRCLSATVVWKGYRPIDFSKPGVLKDAMNLLVGQTINADHETALGNGMGVVKSVVWQNAYTVDNIQIPAGINGEFMIDGKSNPRIARGIMSKPPIIHSNSVSVRFEWEPSHATSTPEEFYSKLGTKDDKGNLYRLIVTKIAQFSETSLVPHGADPYAQIITNGKINNPVYAAGVYNFSAKDDNGNNMGLTHFIDYKTDLSLDAIPLELNKDNNNQSNEDSMEILKQLETILGLEPGSLENTNEVNLSETIANFAENKVTVATGEIATKLTAAEEQVTNLEAEKTTLAESLSTLTTERDALKLGADKYEEVILSKREEAKRLYNLSKGDDAKAEILSMIEGCEETVLESLTDDYKEGVKLKFPPSCKSCGSNEVNMSSSLGGDNGDNPPAPKTQTATELRDDLRRTSRANNKLN